MPSNAQNNQTFKLADTQFAYVEGLQCVGAPPRWMDTQGVVSLWIIWLVCACNVGVSDGRYTLGVRREGDPAIWAMTTWSQQQQPGIRAGIRGVKVKSQASERAGTLRRASAEHEDSF